MKIFLDNVDPSSLSGPNTFGTKLTRSLIRLGHFVSLKPFPGDDVQLSFIETTRRTAPKVVLRLDGIYFNSRQSWPSLNSPIERSYRAADGVVFQTEFDKKLVEKYFGPHPRGVVIPNGTCLDVIEGIQPIDRRALGLAKFSEVWCCSASWRPHKRLKDDIDYFLRFAPLDAGLVVLGENPDHVIEDPRVVYVGKVTWPMCIAIYKACTVFVHLAYLDHCPNVVLDARASGCHIVAASSGGTKEVAGLDATIVEDDEWDFAPLDLYSPPALHYDRRIKNTLDASSDIERAVEKYVDFLESVVSKT